MTLDAESRLEFRASCRELFAKRATEDRLRRYLEEPHPGFDEDLWADVTEQGWALAALPERLDGADAGVADLVVAIEEAGRRLAVPAATSTLASVNVLARHGFFDEHQALVEALAEGAAFAYPHTAQMHAGTKEPLPSASESVVLQLVSDLPTGSFVVAPVAGVNGSRLGVALVDAVEVRPVSTIDLVRGYSSVTVPPDAWIGFIEDADATRALYDIAVVLQSAESLGAATTAYDMTAAYVKERRQFDRKIGSFQTIKHRLANMLIALETARVTVEAAAEAIDIGNDIAASVHTAKSVTARAASWVTSEAQQVHGGIGFTWEHVLHLFIRRAKANELLLGSPAWHERALVDVLGRD